jgi:prepilin peptidase CpaA
MAMHSFAWWPTVAVLAIATFTDLRSRRIPNWLVLPFLAAGLVVPAIAHGWHGLGQSLEGFGLGLLVYGGLAIFAGMGMGDVKLVTAIGAWIGPRQLFLAMVLTAMAGGVMALGSVFVSLAAKHLKKARQVEQEPAEDTSAAPAEAVPDDPLLHKIPYAPAIAVGTLLSFFAH